MTLKTKEVQGEHGKKCLLHLIRYNVSELYALRADLLKEQPNVEVPQWKINAVWDCLFMGLPVSGIVIAGGELIQGQEEFAAIVGVIGGSMVLEPTVMVCNDMLPKVEQLNVKSLPPMDRHRMLVGCAVMVNVLDSNDKMACDTVERVVKNNQRVTLEQ